MDEKLPYYKITFETCYEYLPDGSTQENFEYFVSFYHKRGWFGRLLGLSVWELWETKDGMGDKTPFSSYMKDRAIREADEEMAYRLRPKCTVVHEEPGYRIIQNKKGTYIIQKRRWYGWGEVSYRNSTKEKALEVLEGYKKPPPPPPEERVAYVQYPE